MNKLETLKSEQQRTRKRLVKDKQRLRELDIQIRLLEQREQLQQLVDIPDGVVIGFADRANLRGKSATIKKVNRCRDLVEVAGEEWDMPFSLLKVDILEADLELQLNQALN